MRDLTTTQKRVYYIIKDFIEQKGYSPSFREIAALHGATSPATIQFHLKNLRDKGYISYIDNKSRTLTILK